MGLTDERRRAVVSGFHEGRWHRIRFSSTHNQWVTYDDSGLTDLAPLTRFALILLSNGVLLDATTGETRCADVSDPLTVRMLDNQYQHTKALLDQARAVNKRLRERLHDCEHQLRVFTKRTAKGAETRLTWRDDADRPGVWVCVGALDNDVDLVWVHPDEASCKRGNSWAAYHFVLGEHDTKIGRWLRLGDLPDLDVARLEERHGADVHPRDAVYDEVRHLGPADALAVLARLIKDYAGSSFEQVNARDVLATARTVKRFSPESGNE